MKLYTVISKMAGNGPTFPDDTENVAERTTDPRSQTQIVRNAPPATPREGGQFMSPHATGDYGTRNYSEEVGMMNTSVMPQPNSDYLEPETIGSVKSAGHAAALRMLGIV